ncbi:MAG TPA: biopolymer transporter ExbD [Candidatus Krumholzibacteriaceae bacterium]|nr:biopolymer transporter ExbD [Candidatus Krumholzibacteriaceae bacterium]
MKISKKQGVQNTIPTGSMADIIFLLLIFFMVTTIFKMESGLPITLPRAESGGELQRERLITVWADRYNRISINDKLMRVDDIDKVVGAKLEENSNLIVAFKVDRIAKYRLVSDIIEQLKHANAINVTFVSVAEES